MSGGESIGVHDTGVVVFRRSRDSAARPDSDRASYVFLPLHLSPIDMLNHGHPTGRPVRRRRRRRSVSRQTARKSPGRTDPSRIPVRNISRQTWRDTLDDAWPFKRHSASTVRPAARFRTRSPSRPSNASPPPLLASVRPRPDPASTGKAGPPVLSFDPSE